MNNPIPYDGYSDGREESPDPGVNTIDLDIRNIHTPDLSEDESIRKYVNPDTI